MIKFALWRCSPSYRFMIAWRPSKLGLLPPGAIPSCPIFQLMPSLSPLLALAPLQPCQELERELMQLEVHWVLLVSFQLGQRTALLLPTAPQVLLHAAGVGEMAGSGRRCGTISLRGLKTIVIHSPPKLSREEKYASGKRNVCASFRLNSLFYHRLPTWLWTGHFNLFLP